MDGVSFSLLLYLCFETTLKSRGFKVRGLVTMNYHNVLYLSGLCVWEGDGLLAEVLQQKFHCINDWI